MMDFASFIQDNTVLRPHQIEAKAKIFEAWSKYDSVMLQMPTGTGKTYLFTSLINDLINTYKQAHKDIKILIVAHRTELLDQISATLNKFGIAHGFIQGAREQYLWKRVQVGSIMSLLTDKNYYNVCKQKFDYIIVDEAHHSLADTYIRLFGLFPQAKKLGVTATPWRLNHESFLLLYQYLIVSPQISWFINNNLLSDFDYVSIKPDSEVQRLVDHSQVLATGDFSNTDLDNTFNNQRIRSKLFESYLKFANGRKGIIYAINKCHAAKIADLYSNHGVKAMAIDCDTPKDVRQDLISAFKSGEISVLVNVDIFTEGFDCPDAFRIMTELWNEIVIEGATSAERKSEEYLTNNFKTFVNRIYSVIFADQFKYDELDPTKVPVGDIKLMEARNNLINSVIRYDKNAKVNKLNYGPVENLTSFKPFSIDEMKGEKISLVEKLDEMIPVLNQKAAN